MSFQQYTVKHTFPVIAREFFNRKEINSSNSCKDLQSLQDIINTNIEEPLASILIGNIIDFGLETVKETIMYYWLKLADEAVVNVITPWTLENTLKDKSLSKFFGKPERTISIIVEINGRKFNHNLTEELALGLLITLEGVQGCYLYLEDIEDIPLTLKDLIGNYVNVSGTTYNVDTQYGNIGFNSTDLVQGVITGARWTNTYPSSYINNLREGNTPLNFLIPGY